jgi:hypothetical protein
MYAYLGGGPLVVEVSTKNPALLEVFRGYIVRAKRFERYKMPLPKLGFGH